MDQKLGQKIDLLFLVVLIFFGIIVFLPAIYVLKYFPSFDFFANTLIIQAVLASFLISIIVTIINLLFGIPIAWVLVRSKNKVVRWIDNLVDLSLVMPTAALGFSIYLYWGTKFSFGKLFGLDNGFISQGPLMIILLHLVFTLPYMIRSVTAAITQVSDSYEEAAVTLGASPLTFFRTISLPLFRDGVVNGSVLSFTRSLSETGATMMVAGTFATAPVLIINLKNQGNMSAAAGASIILIISAIIVLFSAKLLLGQKRVNLSWAKPKLEADISRLAPLKNIIIFTFFVVFIFLPTIHIIFYSFSNFRTPNLVMLSQSLILSLVLALLVTVVNLIFAVPFAYLIARNRYRIGSVIDTLSEIVLLMPTSALGLSLALFWRQIISSEVLILFLAHLSFTFPLLVKPITSAFKEIASSQEEAAYSMGANIKTTFTTVLLPQIQPAIIAGTIMAFMRSLSETGATLAVSGKIKTVSILIVDLFKASNLAEAAFACTLLFLITFILLFILKSKQKHVVSSV
jgi:thiamine transport system permease protein